MVVVAAFAVALLAALDPAEAIHPAFLLSVLATVAVLGAPRPSEPSVPAIVRAALVLSCRAVVATAPVVWWCFDGVPLVGVVANLVLVPLASFVLVPLAVLHAAVSAVSADVGLAIAPLFEIAAQSFDNACRACAAVDAARTLPPLSVPQGVAFAVGAFALLFVRGRRAQVGVVLATAAALLVGELALVQIERPTGVLRATFVDVGQGDAALIDLPDGRLMAVDAGGGGGNPGAHALVPLLRARRRARIDVFVLSHPHPDHYEGLAALLDAVEITEIWDSGQAAAESEDGAATRLLDLAARRGARVLRPPTLCRGPRVFGDAVVEVLAPCPRYDPGYDPNDNSIVLRVGRGRRALLLVGDAEAHEEEVLRRAPPGRLRADVLKVGHHGSRTSTTPAFVAAVDPRVAIVSAGAANRYGHPHAEVTRRLQEARARVVVTATQGGTIVWTDGDELEVTPWQGDRFSVP